MARWHSSASERDARGDVIENGPDAPRGCARGLGSNETVTDEDFSSVRLKFGWASRTAHAARLPQLFPYFFLPNSFATSASMAFKSSSVGGLLCGEFPAHLMTCNRL